METRHLRDILHVLINSNDFAEMERVQCTVKCSVRYRNIVPLVDSTRREPRFGGAHGSRLDVRYIFQCCIQGRLQRHRGKSSHNEEYAAGTLSICRRCFAEVETDIEWYEPDVRPRDFQVRFEYIIRARAQESRPGARSPRSLFAEANSRESGGPDTPPAQTARD